jgi:hypothetical protein
MFGSSARLCRDKALPLGELARHLARAPDGLAGLSRSAFRRLFVGAAAPQLAKETFSLKLFLEEPERLVDVVVANEDLDGLLLFWFVTMDFGWSGCAARRAAHRAVGLPTRV